MILKVKVKTHVARQPKMSNTKHRESCTDQLGCFCPVLTYTKGVCICGCAVYHRCEEFQNSCAGGLPPSYQHHRWVLVLSSAKWPLPAAHWLNKRNVMMAWSLTSFSFGNSEWEAYENMVSKCMILLLKLKERETARQHEKEERERRKAKLVSSSILIFLLPPA